MLINYFLSQNLAILDIEKLLACHKDDLDNPLQVPDHLILQFDNCAENKVRLYARVVKSMYTNVSSLLF